MRTTMIGLLGMMLLCLVPMSASAQREQQRDFREDAAYEELIHQLEMGMVALEELGRHDALEILSRVTDEVRTERRAAREVPREAGGNRERELAQRLARALRLTEKACREAERTDAGDLARHAYRALEMQLEGRRDEEARLYIEKAPRIGAKLELLAMATELWTKWGRPEEAAFTGEVYRTIMELRERRSEPQREAVVADLEALERRIEIIRYARDAFAETGDRKNARLLTGAIHYGELTVSGAGEEALAEAAAGVPDKGNLVEGLRWAARQYGEWGKRERAGACKRLAEYYARQLREERSEGEHEHGEAEHEGEHEGAHEEHAEDPAEGTHPADDLQLQRLMRRIEKLQLELREIERVLHEHLKR